MQLHERLAAISAYLGMDPEELRQAMLSMARRLKEDESLAADISVEGDRSSILKLGALRHDNTQRWFREANVRIASNSLQQLTLILRCVARDLGKSLPPDILTMPDVSFRQHYPTNTRHGEQQEPIVPAVFRLGAFIPISRLEDVQRRYGGFYYLYRVHSSRPGMLRELFWIGEVDLEIGGIRCEHIDSNLNKYSGCVIPDTHNLQVFMTYAAERTSFIAHSIKINRTDQFEKFLAGLILGVVDNMRIPVAMRLILERMEASEFDDALGLDPNDPTLCSHITRAPLPEDHPLHEKFYPHLLNGLSDWERGTDEMITIDSGKVINRIES